MRRDMHTFPIGRRALAVLATALLALGAHGLAQFEGDPFFDRPDDVRHAYRIHVMDARLTALAEVAREGRVPDDLDEHVEALAENDLPRIAGSLGAADAALLEELRASVEGVEDAFEAGEPDGVIEASEATMDVTGRALDALIGAGALDDRQLKAALMTQLLLGEPGAAEGYEEFFEERWEWSVGWAALQQLHDLWGDLAADAGERTADFEEALAALDELMPQVIPPEGTIVGDPEDSEGAAHDAVAYLQQITGTHLHPDRDLGRLASHLVERTGTACDHYAEGADALGREYALSVVDQFEYLEDVAGTLVPDAAEEAEEALEELAGGGLSGDRRSALCEDASEALNEIRAMLGG